MPKFKITWTRHDNSETGSFDKKDTLEASDAASAIRERFRLHAGVVVNVDAVGAVTFGIADGVSPEATTQDNTYSPVVPEWQADGDEDAISKTALYMEGDDDAEGKESGDPKVEDIVVTAVKSHNELALAQLQAGTVTHDQYASSIVAGE